MSLTILHYDDKHLSSWAPCTLLWVRGSPVCCSCAAPGSHPIFYTSKQGTSALPVYFGSAYFPLTAGLLVPWKWIHVFICSTDISCCSKAAPLLELVDACNLCRGIRSTICLSSSRAAGNRIHETAFAKDKNFVTWITVSKHCSNHGSAFSLNSKMPSLIGHLHLLLGTEADCSLEKLIY